MSVRVGIIGCGRWGTTHLQTLADLKSSGKISEIHACDIISEKRLKIGHLVDSFSSSWQEMINQNELDIVAVVTPAESHYEITMELLDYCQNLFIEKPIGISQPQATGIISKTQEVGGTVLVGHILRFHDLINKANTLIAEGLIGELQRIDFTRITTRPPPKNSNVFDALAIHGIDTTCFCFGELEPTRLSVDKLRLTSELFPVGARISLEFPGIKEASISVGWEGEKEAREILFSGSKGKIILETKNNDYLHLILPDSEQKISIENYTSPLTKEWLYIIEESKKNQSTTTYPQPGSIIRCMKWVEKAKQEIEKTISSKKQVDE